jgi:hypothetical protein
VDFKAVAAGIKKANTKMTWGRLKDVKEGDRIVEDERG